MEIGAACSHCFAGLSCGSRIEILNILKKKGKMSVLEIAKYFKLSQPTITHHLLYLKNVGLLSSQKEGKQVFYFINPKCGLEICKLFV